MADTVAAVVVAAGRGLRAGGDVPKQYREIAGEPVIRPALAAFLHIRRSARCSRSFIRDDEAFRAATARPEKTCRRRFRAARRGRLRCAPGLRRLRGSAPDIVLIHDAARPFLTGALIGRAIAAGQAKRRRGAGASPSPTPSRRSMTTATVDRDARSQPPAHGANAASLRLRSDPRRASPRRGGGPRRFYRRCRARRMGRAPRQRVRGRGRQRQAHHQRRFRPRRDVRICAALADVRTGNGFDVHAFADGDHVMLGGVRIPHSRGLTGHSDADVALHALVDAILGALAEGDIGSHFPPSDPQWKGASSDRFLAFACERVRARGGVIAQSRRDHRVRSAARLAASRRHARAHRRDRRHCRRARRRQGDDQREARLHRPRRRHRRDGDGNGAVAVERDA